MPRPYGLILGEGTTKNQRWGLGSIQSDFDTFMASGGFEASPYYPNPNVITPGMLTSPDYLNNLVGPSMNVMSGNTIGDWIKANSGMLLIGGAIGLFLWKR